MYEFRHFALAFVFVLYIVKLNYYSFDYALKFTIIFWIAFYEKYNIYIYVKKLDRWVLHELNAHQMKKRFNACVSLLSRNKRKPFLHRIVTYDEKCILYDNRKCSANWLDKDDHHQKKLMVTGWRSSHGLIYYTFIKPNI